MWMPSGRELYTSAWYSSALENVAPSMTLGFALDKYAFEKVPGGGENTSPSRMVSRGIFLRMVSMRSGVKYSRTIL